MDYYIRDIPEEVDEAILRQFPAGSPTRGQNSPKQGFLRSCVLIVALGPDYAAPAYDLWQSALRIAARQRGEAHVKDTNATRYALLKEMIEFDSMLLRSATPLPEILNRLSNLIYYSVVEYVQNGDMQDLIDSLKVVSEKAEIHPLVAMRVAAAKYLDRSARDTKDVEAEREAMLRVYEQFSKLV